MNATYSPEDNKLRLYPAHRLDTETYNRVKAAGFKWAPRQGLFVTPMWTPKREDLLMELCGEIGDEDTSLVERAEERAERFEEYSDKREADAHRAHEAVEAITEHIPMGQPILVGHHSEKHARKDAQRIENGMRKAVKMWETAKYWEQRAAGALAHAKYKELPAVRARRIKTIEADLRSKIASYTPHAGQPVVMQRRWNDSSEDAPRVPHVWVGPKGRGCYLLPVDRIEAVKAAAQRWITHYENRLIYEKAMLAEAGASELLDKKPRPKQLPLCNYRAQEGIASPNIYHRGEMVHYPQVEMTQAEYARINVDYKGTRVVGNSHRVRIAMVKMKSVCVFLTDSKVHERPADIDPKLPAPRERIEPRAYVAPEPTPFDAIKQQLREGVQVVSAPQLFPTPSELAARMVEAAAIESGMEVLEPSAGTGAIVDAIRSAMIDGSAGRCAIRAVEINRTLAHRLAFHDCLSGDRVTPGDFLECNGDLGLFDRIIMNPPFENASDIKHIQHALHFLKPGGRLVALCANGPRQQEKLKPLASYWGDLPADTFKSEGTSVRAALLVIE